MAIVAPVPFISALHNALQRNDPAPPGPSAERIVRRALADGWTTPLEIKNWLIETDGRLWQVTRSELLRTYGIPTQDVFERPTRAAHDAEGLPRVSVVDFARLLVMLERSGLAIDPVPLCRALAPGLGAKRLLTGPELVVYWRAERRCDEPLTLAASRLEIGCGASFTTKAGFTVQAFYEGDPECDHGEERPDVLMLTVLPPAGTKHRPAKVTSSAGRRHLRRYLGEPRAGRSPDRPAPAPAA